MIIGLDISTSTIGYTVLCLTGGVISIGYVKPIGNNIFEKVQHAIQELERILPPIPIAAIYAEAPNIMFKAGFSSAQVLALILRFNGAILYTLYKKFGTYPHEVMASSARKQVIGIGRWPRGINTKTEVLKWTQSQIQIQWPIVEKGKHKGELLSECFDMADSYVICRYGLLKLEKEKNGRCL